MPLRFVMALGYSLRGACRKFAWPFRSSADEGDIPDRRPQSLDPILSAANHFQGHFATKHGDCRKVQREKQLQALKLACQQRIRESLKPESSVSAPRCVTNCSPPRSARRVETGLPNHARGCCWFSSLPRGTCLHFRTPVTEVARRGSRNSK